MRTASACNRSETQDMNLVDFFDRGAQRNPLGPCLVEGEQSLNYSDVTRWTHRIARALREAGISVQGRVAMLAYNNLWGFVALLGMQRARCVWIPLNARSALAENIAHMKRTQSEWLFYQAEFAPYLNEIRQEIPTLKGATCLDDAANSGASLDNWASTDDSAIESDPVDPRGDDFRITSSGGTTGNPKAVIQSQRVVETNVASFLAILRYDEAPRYLLCNPMTHAAGVSGFHAFALGGTIYLMRTPELPKVVEHIERHRISMLMLTPTSVYSLLALPGIRERDFSSLRYLMFGAAPMSAAKLQEAMDVLGPVMMHAYGQSEASPLVAAFMPDEYARMASDPAFAKRLHSCGRATPFTQVAIMDEQGKLLACGERGELVVRSGMVMRGYLGEAELSETASAHGWHHTGDVATLDEEGYIYIVDRIRDLIISGGFNVFPSEVEQVIWAHPAVSDCAVIGVPDEKWGEAVKAVIELKPGASATESEIIEMCKARLGSVKSPKTVEFWEELPRSQQGKVLKKEVRKHFWTDRAI